MVLFQLPFQVSIILAAVVVSTPTIAITTSYDYTAKDSRGHIIKLSKAPLKIISLCPGTTEMIYAIGLGNRLIADTTYCDYPENAKQLPKIGDVTTSIEKVIALNTDLIIASYSANHTAVDLLEKHQQKVFCVDSNSLEEVAADMVTLGKLSGTEGTANASAEKMRKRLAQLKSSLKQARSNPKALVIVQFDPLLVVGPNNFMDDLIRRAGATNLGIMTGKAWGGMSPEQVIVVKPEIIIAGKNSHDRIVHRPGWENIPAVKNRRIYDSPGDAAVRPGPRLVAALETLIRQIHPEVKIPPP